MLLLPPLCVVPPPTPPIAVRPRSQSDVDVRMSKRASTSSSCTATATKVKNMKTSERDVRGGERNARLTFKSSETMDCVLRGVLEDPDSRLQHDGVEFIYLTAQHVRYNSQRGGSW